jgi:NAD(P)-dependent dehydrogenase (short-subunit alcohol dehydrogenase family)
MGTVKPTKAVWEIMKAQNYGRIVVTTSSTGLYGNFGQANYGAAKLSLVGFMNTMKLEGSKNDIRVNAISPVAATRMTENIMPPQMLEALKPEFVTPGVIHLASREAPNGAILTAGAGVFALAQIYETDGIVIPADKLSAEAVRDQWTKITDPTGHEAYSAGNGQTQKFMRKLSGG